MKGNPSDLDNYRGISLLNTIFKLFERLLMRRLDIFFTKYNLISELQGGFRKGRGTQENLMILMAARSQARMENLPFFVSFLDLKKACDQAFRNSALFCSAY